MIALLLLSSVYFVFFFLRSSSPEVDFVITDRNQSYFTGEYFQGSPKAPELKDLFIQQRNNALKEHRDLIVVNYESDTLKSEIRQFIGISAEKVPDKLQRSSWLEMPPGSYASAELMASDLSRINPTDIKDQAIHYAKTQSKELETTISYEIYEGDAKLKVLFLIH